MDIPLLIYSFNDSSRTFWVKHYDITLILDHSTDVEGHQPTPGVAAKVDIPKIESSKYTLEPTNLPLASSQISQPIESYSKLNDETSKSACQNQSSLSSNSTKFGKFIRQLLSQTFCNLIV